MPTVYCYNGGSNTSPYDTWAKAATTLDVAHAACAAGDTLIVASDHAETLGGAVTLSEGTGGGAPIVCYSANRGSGAIETMNAGGGLITCSTNAVTFSSPCAYYYGLKFTSANTANAYSVATAGSATAQHFESCYFICTSSGGSVRNPSLGAASGLDDTAVTFRNCTFKFGASTSQRMAMLGGRYRFIGCSWEITSSTVPATLILPVNGGHCDAVFRDCDMSVLTGNMVDASVAICSKFKFAHCRMGSGWAATTGAIPGYGGIEVDIEACDTAASDSMRHEIVRYAGNMVRDTAVYRDSGASQPSSDTATDPLPFSWKVTTNAACYFTFPLELPPIYQYYNGVIDGTTKTVTVCYTQDNATNLNNDEIWMEVEHMATDGTVMGTVDVDDKKADVVASAAAQADDTSTWTGDEGWSNANPQKMEATIAPREKGYIIARIYVAKASVSAAPIYIDPLITVS